MDLLENLKMSLLNFNFVMIYKIYKMLALPKYYPNYPRYSILECFFMEHNRLFLVSQIIFFTTCNNGKLNLEEKKMIKYIRNLLRLKKEPNYTAIKNIRNLFRLEKETKAIKDRILRDIENAIKDRIPGDIKNLSKHEEEENYYKPVRVIHFWSKNYIDFESNND